METQQPSFIYQTTAPMVGLDVSGEREREDPSANSEEHVFRLGQQGSLHQNSVKWVKTVGINEHMYSSAQSTEFLLGDFSKSCINQFIRFAWYVFLCPT